MAAMTQLMVVPIRDKGDAVLIVSLHDGEPVIGYVTNATLRDYFQHDLTNCDGLLLVKSLGHFPSSRKYSRTMLPVRHTWKLSAGRMASYASGAAMRASHTALPTGLTSCGAEVASAITGLQRERSCRIRTLD